MAAAAKKRARKTISPWTQQDLKALKTMARQKMFARQAAKKLKRTLAAVYMKASQEKISFKK